MPVPVSYPGVYIEELPSGQHTISGVATSITAFVGRAELGPVDEPFTIFSFADYQRSFGELRTDYPMSFAVSDFFLNGGSQAVIVRLFGGQAPVETSTCARTPAQSPPTVLPLRANNPGTWGRGLTATVDYPLPKPLASDPAFVQGFGRYGLAPEDLFDLTITRQPATGPSTVERFQNLTVKDGTTGGCPARYDRVLAGQSRWVQAPEDVDFSTLASPAAGAVPFDPQTGADSAALSPEDYVAGAATKTGIYALNKVDLFNLLCLPPDQLGGDTDPLVYSAAAALCQERRAFLILDPPSHWAGLAASRSFGAIDSNDPQLGITGESGRYAAVYFPRVEKMDPSTDGRVKVFPPCGIVAGLMAAADVQRGVWKAPAGQDAGIQGIVDLEVKLTDAENALLNPRAINCLRIFPVIGPVIWGARTLRGADEFSDDYKYISVRRLANFIEESIYRGTQWAAFEPNAEPLWSALRLSIGSFLADLAQQGAFYNYTVQCDHTTTTSTDISSGIVRVLVLFAPVSPAEFMVISIQLQASQAA